MGTRINGAVVPVSKRRRTSQERIVSTPFTEFISKVRQVYSFVPIINFVPTAQKVFQNSTDVLKNPLIPAIPTASASSRKYSIRESRFRDIPIVDKHSPVGSTVKAVKMSDTKMIVDITSEPVCISPQRDDDIIYLYSVDTSSSGRIAEEVDLVDESKIARNTTSNRGLEFDESAPKSYVLLNRGAKRKREANDGFPKRPNSRITGPHCTICNTRYATLAAREQPLCRAKCGHLFCLSCAMGPKGKKVCEVCGQKIASLCKLYV